MAKMTEIRRSVILEAPVHEVFEYVSDFRNWPDFHEGISNIVPLTKSTRESGSRFIYDVQANGITFEMGMEFQDFKADKGWIGHSFNGGIDSKTLWLFNHANGNTFFTHAILYTVPWYMGGRLYDRLFGQSTWRTIIEHTLQNLKRIVEIKPAELVLV